MGHSPRWEIASRPDALCGAMKQMAMWGMACSSMAEWAAGKTPTDKAGENPS